MNMPRQAMTKNKTSPRTLSALATLWLAALLCLWSGVSLAGNITSRSTVNGTTSYEYDVMNRLAKVTDSRGGVTTYTYDAAGKRTDRTLPNGVHSHWTYNTNDQLTGLHHETAAGALLADYQYTLDAKGQRIGMVETFADPTTAGVTHTRTLSYAYDSLDRLTGEVAQDPDNALGGSYSRIYAYDSTGNRTRQEETRNGQTTVTTYGYNINDQLITETITDPTGAVTVSYQYDNNGNLTQKANPHGVIARYAYTADNRLQQVEQGTRLTQYRYDVNGNRISATVTDTANAAAPVKTVQYWLVDPNFPYPEVLEEYDGQGGLIALNTFTPDRAGDLLSITRGGQGTYYAGEDGHGSLRQLVSASGGVVASEQTTAWGEVLPGAALGLGDWTAYGYTGERQDRDAGLVYLRAREYAPGVGRFLQRDKFLGYPKKPMSLLSYIYSYSSPAVFMDPDGFSPLMETTLVQNEQLGHRIVAANIEKSAQRNIAARAANSAGKSFERKIGDMIEQCIGRARFSSYRSGSSVPRIRTSNDEWAMPDFLFQMGDKIHYFELKTRIPTLRSIGDQFQRLSRQLDAAVNNNSKITVLVRANHRPSTVERRKSDILANVSGEHGAIGFAVGMTDVIGALSEYFLDNCLDQFL